MFEQFTDEPLRGTRKRLWASMAGAGAVYAVLGVGAAALFAGYAAPALVEEPSVDVKFVASAPPPPPPPPTLPPPVDAPPPPPPPPKARPARPDEVLTPPKPIEVPNEIPAEAPREADPSQETGPPPAAPGETAGEGDPFGQRGGKTGGTPLGQPGGAGSAPAAPAPEKPVILPPGATAPEPVDPKARPAYPPAALEARFEGEVVVKVIVHVDGHVEVMKVIKSDPNFDAAVLAFLKTYAMKPAMYNGKPIAVYRNLRFPFTLD
ncbi:energy transducer TonB [Myxococcota bacterium]|nr:energy transducer TonB [Myxococcota bacterium]